MLENQHGNSRRDADPPIVLTAEERSTLESWVRSGTTEQRLVERAQVVLLAAAGTMAG